MIVLWKLSADSMVSLGWGKWGVGEQADRYVGTWSEKRYIYWENKERQEKAFKLLELLGCSFSTEQAGMFVWGKVPGDFKDGYALSDHLLYGCDVFITPGGIFGENGAQYIRISLCSETALLEEAFRKISVLLGVKMETV